VHFEQYENLSFYKYSKDMDKFFQYYSSDTCAYDENENEIYLKFNISFTNIKYPNSVSNTKVNNLEVLHVKKLVGPYTENELVSEAIKIAEKYTNKQAKIREIKMKFNFYT